MKSCIDLLHFLTTLSQCVSRCTWKWDHTMRVFAIRDA